MPVGCVTAACEERLQLPILFLLQSVRFDEMVKDAIIEPSIKYAFNIRTLKIIF